MKIFKAPLRIQNQYAEFTKQIDKSKLILQKSLENLIGETK